MRHKILLLVALFALSISSCKKNDDTSNNTSQNNQQQPPPEDPKEKVIQITTDFGTMYMWLYKQTPLHRDNFLRLADSGFFDSTTFHRIVSNFVIQGGDPNSKDADPTNDGTGGPDYTIPAEFVDSIKHQRGAVGAARLPDSVNPNRESNGSQFYICLNTANTTGLNGKYTVFGFIMKGMEVADSIVKQPKDVSNDRPITDIRMQVKILQKTVKEIQAEYNFTPPN